jgi:hypothetical protein
MVCQICQGSEFYEDEGSSAYFCTTCNTQSQELFAESFELDDNNDVLIARVKGTLARANHIPAARRSQAKLTHEAVPAEVDDYLAAYQACIQHVLKSILEIVKSTTLEMKVRELWFRYLERWQLSGYPLLPAFERSRSVEFENIYFSNHPLQHPPYPTKNLIFGLIYFALRLEFSWVIPGDLVRWCMLGRVPYVNLWNTIDPQVRARIPGSKIAFDRCDYVATNGLTTINVFFHAYVLAESLDMKIPPLNSYLVARAMFSALRVPSSCWRAFCSITQTFRGEQPLHTLILQGDEVHPEYVMAACIVSIKLQKNWTGWDYILDDNERYTPMSLEELDLVPRGQIESLLRDLRSALRDNHLSETRMKYNYAVLKALADTPSSRPIWGRVREDDEVQISRTVLSSSSPMEDQNISRRDKLYLRHLNLRVNINRASDPIFVKYLAHTEVVEDKTAILHPQYVALLERCAKHVCCAPGVLHTLVSRIDLELASVVYRRRRTIQRNRTLKKCDSAIARVRNYKPRKNTCRLNKMFIRCIKRLGLLRLGWTNLTKTSTLATSFKARIKVNRKQLVATSDSSSDDESAISDGNDCEIDDLEDEEEKIPGVDEAIPPVHQSLRRKRMRSDVVAAKNQKPKRVPHYGLPVALSEQELLPEGPTMDRDELSFEARRVFALRGNQQWGNDIGNENDIDDMEATENGPEEGEADDKEDEEEDSEDGREGREADDEEGERELAEDCFE